MENILIVRAFSKRTHETGKAYFTDKENLDKCIKTAKLEHIKQTLNPAFPTEYLDSFGCYVNKATMCFDGYLTNGDYIGEY